MERATCAEKTLEQTYFVIAEVSASPRFRDGYPFHEFVAEMARHGFVLHDIFGKNYRRALADGREWFGLTWMDAYFLREDRRPVGSEIGETSE